MLRVLAGRYVVIAAMIFAVGVVEVAIASTISPTSQLHQLDLGDDDGDGIPNYLDPDDNNDGTADRDTPAEVPPATEEPTPEIEVTVEPVVTPDITEPEPEPQQEPEPEPDAAPPVAEEPAPTAAPEPVATQPQAESVVEVPQVSSLPNTGAGSGESSWYTPLTLILFALLSVRAMATRLVRVNRG